MNKQADGIDNVSTNVGTQHRTVTPSHSPFTHRPSPDHSASDDDFDRDALFVRKRAYTSPRQVVLPDQLNASSALRSPRLCSPPHSVSRQSNPSCQLLLATPQPTLLTNTNLTTPQVTHLRRRRSSQSIPTNYSKSRNATHADQLTLPTVPSPTNYSAPICFSSVKENATFSPIVTGEAPLLIQDSGADSSLEPSRLRDPVFSEGHIFPRRGKSQNNSVVRAALGDIRCSSFNSDPNEPDEALWSKAGDAYRAIALANDQIAQKLAARRERQLRAKCYVQQDLSEAMHDLYLNTNKENKIGDPWKHFAGSETWSSPIVGYNRYSAFSSQKSCASSRLGAVHKDTASHTRILCPGLRPHRSESNIRRGLSGSFLSRQCLCKILSLDGSIGKSHSWKPYYMSITTQEVRFIKASSALHSMGRSQKSSKLSNQGSVPPNTDLLLAKDELPPSNSFEGTKSPQLSVTSHQGLLNSFGERTHLKDSLSASHLTLPITGLMWNSEEVPADLPQWLPLGQVTVAHSQSVTPDHMDPLLSGLSKSHDPMEEDDPLNYSKPIESSFGSVDAVRASFRCFRFTHLDAAVELLFVFPDESVALTCLNMCKLFGGRPIYRKDAAQHLLEDRCHERSRDTVELPGKKALPVLPQIGEEKFPIAPRLTGGKAFFMQSIKQFLNRSTGGHNVNVSSDSASFSTFPPSVESKLAAILSDPPDFCDLQCPGPVFGSPLEDQLESPDYSFVPVLLHCFVTALEYHGISLPGLYRKPGRQRSISQFVCVSNLVPKNVELLLTLDAWSEPYAICGLLKYFLRRLPSRLLELGSWEPLALLVPDKDSPSDLTRQAYLLLSIRVKLWKMASEACGAPSGCLIPLCPIDPHVDGRCDRATNSSETSNASCTNRSQVSAKWRWATLFYVVHHLRNVVSYETKNEVTHQCAAICFGPVLFDDSIHVDKLNVVLENVLRHWRWLVHGLPMVRHADLSPSIPRIQTHEWTLQEAVEYLRKFDLSEPKLTPYSNDLLPALTINSGTTTQQFEKRSSFSAPSQSLIQVIKSLFVRSLKKAEVSSISESPSLGDHFHSSTTSFSLPCVGVASPPNVQSLNRCLTPPCTHFDSNSHDRGVNNSLLSFTNSTPSQTTKPAVTDHYVNQLRRPTTSSEVSLLSSANNECLPRSSSYKF